MEIHSTKEAYEVLKPFIENIPYAEKDAYLEAVDNSNSSSSSFCLERESDPLHFLQREDYDGWAAACRLASYWEERKKAFRDKAFLPLTHGSYTEEAIQAIWNGTILILPNDSQGRTVVYRDEKKMVLLSLTARLQLLFYIDFVAKSNPASSKDGVVVLTSIDRISFDRNNKICNHVSNKCMPTRIHSFHILCKTAAMADSIALGLFQWLSNDNVHFHTCKTPEECAKKLSEFGLKKDRLPVFLGGSGSSVPCDSFIEEETKRRASIFAPGQKPNRLEKKVLDNLIEAIQALPLSEKAACMDALKIAPTIFETESPPAWFLWYEQSNTWAAARRLASYWEERKRAFGDKALLSLLKPFDLAPYSEKLKQAFRAGATMRLPNDTSGRPVFFLNSYKMCDIGLSANDRLQHLFYVSTMVMQSSDFIEKGVVFLLKREIYNTHGFEENVRIWNKITPFATAKVHVICKNRNFLDGIAPPVFQVAQWLTKNMTYFHMCQSEEDCAKKLLPFGFTKLNLPTVLGGNWDAVTQNDNKEDISDVSQQRHRRSLRVAHNEENQTNASNFLSSMNATEPSSTAAEMRNLNDNEISSTEKKKQKTQPINEFHDNDVLLGKQAKYVSHPGNVRLQSVIKMNLERYNEAFNKFKETNCHQDRRSLQQINQDVYNVICQNGRFLKYIHNGNEIPGSWCEVSSSSALKKIAWCFRHYGEPVSGGQIIRQTLSEPISSSMVSEGDVLLGKGTKYWRHPGNLHLKQMIELHSTRYDEASKKHVSAPGRPCVSMKEIIQDVYCSIRQSGRFLKIGPDGDWYEVSGDTAREKIAMSFRNTRKRNQLARRL